MGREGCGLIEYVRLTSGIRTGRTVVAYFITTTIGTRMKGMRMKIFFLFDDCWLRGMHSFSI